MRRAQFLVPAIVSAASLLVSCGSDQNTPASPTQPPVDTIPTPQRAQKYLEVTDAYGALSVREGTYSAEADRIPWSAWWLPDSSTYLYKEDPDTHEPAPLQKYDAYFKSTYGHESHAADREAEIRRNNSEQWAGLCNAWAMASVVAPEPTVPFKFGKLTFSLGDLKALLVKSFEYADPKDYDFFGNRNNGDGLSDYQDIFPDQFHRFLQVVLYQKKRAFVMDSDPTPEVWNMPIFAAQTSIHRDRADSHLMHVETWLTGADYRVSTDFSGTRYLSKLYQYDLHGIPQADGSFNVLYGEWVAGSVHDHPDYMIDMKEKVGHASLNTELDTAVVTEILNKAASARGSELGLLGEEFSSEPVPSFTAPEGATYWWLSK